MSSDLLRNVTVKVQPRSGFDKSRKNILTTKVGTLTPILNDLVIPNSDINIKMAINASLPPLASETFMRCSLKVEAFAVPLRILYGGFESFLTGKEEYNVTSASVASSFRASLPYVNLTSTQNTNYCGAGTLADYLGVRASDWTVSTSTAGRLNIFPFLAYHRIYDDWYRNTKVQTPVFIKPGQVASTFITSQAARLRCMPYISLGSYTGIDLDTSFQDGVKLYELRQRNFGLDYFTSATPNAQLGSPTLVEVPAPAQAGDDQYFSISALRSANSITQWDELNNIGGKRIQDYVRANYGAKLSSGIAQRAIYLGSADYPVYSKGVYANQGVTATNNPFTSVGARYGSAYASGSDFVVKAHIDEPCVLMVLCSLVPEANYSSGVSPWMMKLTRSGSIVDIPNPMLQNVGNEPIAVSELDCYSGVRDADIGTAGTIFGYVPRYTWSKTGVNEVHGLLLDGQSLDAFVAQRSFGAGTPSISSNFLKIPTTALDQVTAVTSDLSSYGCWIDSYIQYYVSMPLAQYSIPSLQNPAYEHGVSVSIQRNGSKID